MNNIRFVNAPLKLNFDKMSEDEEKYKREYDKLSNSEEDNVGQWLKLAKARGETSESDQVLLTLIVELHRKVDELSAYIKNEKPSFLNLENQKNIEGIGYEHFNLIDGDLKQGIRYYGRILMPFFPKREIPLFFKALDKNTAQIVLMHDQDKREWSTYMSARERAKIREIKALQE